MVDSVLKWFTHSSVGMAEHHDWVTTALLCILLDIVDYR